jgi:GTP-binding protein
MFVDQAVIHVRGGRGGDGMVSFRREKYVPKGGPDGGNGGDGGSVILRATAGVDTLLDMTGRHHWYAEHGGDGGSKQRSGADGDDLIVKVPPGTLVYDEQSNELLADLDEPDKAVVTAKGGRGGRGNEAFKSATQQTPRHAEPGGTGEQRTLRLELKLIADVGLIGKPNAGKSTLLSRLSKARPKIADYPFTTLEPQLGIAELPGERRLVIADIPGLIEGAAEGAGLGHDFLRHIERTRILVHVLEFDPLDESNLAENYDVIRKELERYSRTLAEKLEIIAINKVDLTGGSEDDVTTAIEIAESELNQPVLAISAATGQGVPALLEQCWATLHANTAEHPTATE